MTLVAIAAGLAHFVATLGVGLLALSAAGTRLRSPWREVVAILLGVAVESTLVEALAMASLAARPALVALWVAFVATGVATVARAVRRGELRLAPDGWRPRGGAERVPLAVGAVALAANLLVAAAPSTKIDELYYHMLVPRRIVEDGALRLYRFPWEAAALPQLGYQIGAAPLHALGVPDAPNVTSWALAATLAWLGWWLLLAQGGARRRLAGWWAATATVGLYGAVWHVTGGAHALGDLALAAALVAAVSGQGIDVREEPRAYAIAVGVLTWSAASTKATLLPICALLLAWGLRRAWRAAAGRERALTLAAGVAPWIAFGLPIVLWSVHLTGTPYGPLLAPWIPGGAYDASEVARLLAATRRLGRNVAALQLAARHTPLLWLAALGALVTLRLPRGGRVALAVVVAVQVALVAGWVSWDPRFLAGLPFGLALLCATNGSPPDAPRTTRGALIAASLLLAPWLAAQLVYSAPILATSAGLVPRERYVARYVALHEDWRALDSLLPPDALLISRVGRTSLSLAPRRVLVDARDLSGDDERRRAYVVGFSCEGLGEGGVVYTNPGAVVATYRTPGRGARRRAICVRKLAR